VKQGAIEQWGIGGILIVELKKKEYQGK